MVRADKTRADRQRVTADHDLGTLLPLAPGQGYGCDRGEGECDNELRHERPAVCDLTCQVWRVTVS